MSVARERLERGLATIAWIVVRHGPVYAPLFDRVEAELKARRQQPDAIERARAILRGQLQRDVA